MHNNINYYSLGLGDKPIASYRKHHSKALK